jgi:hypothetical protein
MELLEFKASDGEPAAVLTKSSLKIYQRLSKFGGIMSAFAHLTNMIDGLHCWLIKCFQSCRLTYSRILYAATTLLIRLSISIFLLRLATRSAHKYVIYATQLIVIVFTIAYIILATRQCAPYDYFWKQYQGGKGSCLDINIVPNASIAQSVVGFIVDWTLGLLPIWIMSSAKLSSKVKLPITGVLSLGLL